MSNEASFLVWLFIFCLVFGVLYYLLGLPLRRWISNLIFGVLVILVLVLIGVVGGAVPLPMFRL